MKNLAPETRGILLVLFACSCFGIMDGISKFLVTNYPTMFVLWIRHLGGVAMLFLVLRPAGVRRFARSARPWFQTGRVLLLVVQMTMVMVCFRLLPLADVHSIMASTPLIVTALSMPLLGERVGWRRWLAVSVGFMGMLLIVRPGFKEIQPAMLLMVVAAIMNGVYNIWTRRVAAFDAAETSWIWQVVVSAVVLSLIGPFFWVWPELVHWPLFAALAAMAALGHYCLIRALATTPAVVIQPFTYTQLLWGVLLGWLVFANLPDQFTVAGAALIIAAGIYGAWREHSLKQQAAPR